MKVGFTGTREGLTDTQKQILRNTIEELLMEGYDEAHHGDCVGADCEFHDMVIQQMIVVIHPPDDTRMEAYCHGNEHRAPKPYLERNHDIVDETDLLIVCPKGELEEIRSGTWATARYARRIGKPVIVIFPNGMKGG